MLREVKLNKSSTPYLYSNRRIRTRVHIRIGRTCTIIPQHFEAMPLSSLLDALRRQQTMATRMRPDGKRGKMVSWSVVIPDAGLDAHSCHRGGSSTRLRSSLPEMDGHAEGIISQEKFSSTACSTVCRSTSVTSMIEPFQPVASRGSHNLGLSTARRMYDLNAIQSRYTNRPDASLQSHRLPLILFSITGRGHPHPWVSTCAVRHETDHSSRMRVQ